jgi:hypothetical protein
MTRQGCCRWAVGIPQAPSVPGLAAALIGMGAHGVVMASSSKVVVEWEVRQPRAIRKCAGRPAQSNGGTLTRRPNTSRSTGGLRGCHAAAIGYAPSRAATGDLGAIIGVPPWKSSTELSRQNRGLRSRRTACMAISESLVRSGGCPPGGVRGSARFLLPPTHLCPSCLRTAPD